MDTKCKNRYKRLVFLHICSTANPQMIWGSGFGFNFSIFFIVTSLTCTKSTTFLGKERTTFVLDILVAINIKNSCIAHQNMPFKK